MSPYYLPATAANCMEANRLRRPSLGARVVALRTRLDQKHATVSGMGYGITWRKTYSIIVFRRSTWPQLGFHCVPTNLHLLAAAYAGLRCTPKNKRKHSPHSLNIPRGMT